MGVNRAQPYIYVLPEDDADRQLANSFHLEIDLIRQRQMQVLPVAGGWLHVLELFKSEHIIKMEQNPNQIMVLLIDFDGQEGRLAKAKADIPDHLTDRVFVLGAWTRPEDLKPHFGSYDDIGKKLAKECREETDMAWEHNLLQHNKGELDRLREHVRPILF